MSSNWSNVLLVFSIEFFVFLDNESTWVNNFAVFSVSSCTWEVFDSAFITYSQSSKVLLVLRWHSSLDAKNCCWSSWIELVRELLLVPVDNHRLFCIFLFVAGQKKKWIINTHIEKETRNVQKKISRSLVNKFLIYNHPCIVSIPNIYMCYSAYYTWIFDGKPYLFISKKRNH